MRTTLNRIELNNIRSHKQVTFEPHKTGITAIAGSNGAGKSSIIDSLAWVLYGSKMNGMKNKDFIREGVNPKKEKVSASIEMTIAGVDYIIEKRITNEQGITQADIWYLKNDKKVHLAGPAVLHTEQYVKQVLGVDEKGFLTATLIQQKQVDQIVTASPRDRGQVIENLTGISGITAASDLCREEIRELQRALNVAHPGDLTKIENKIIEQQTLIESIENEKQELATILENRKIESANKNHIFTDLTKRIESYNELETKVIDLKYRQKYTQDKLADSFEIINSATSNKKTKKLSSKEEITTKLKDINDNIIKLESNKQTLTKRVEKIKPVIDEVEASKSNDNDILQELKEKEERLTQLTENLECSNNKKKETEIEIKKVKTILKQLKNGDSSNCPVCMTELQSVEDLISHYEKEIKEVLNIQNQELQEETAGLANEILSIQELIQSKEELQEKIKKYNRYSEEYKNVKKELSTIETSIKEFRAQKTLLDKELEEVISTTTKQEAVKNAKEMLKVLDKELKEINKELTEYETKQKEIQAPSSVEYNKLKKFLNTYNDDSRKMILNYDKLISNLELAEARFSDYKKELKSMIEAQNVHKDLVKQIKEANNSLRLISEFKKEKIETSIPALVYFTSDILNKFTGGYFMELRLDEKFHTTILTKDGTIRNINQLSGGELSTTAIALRLGIALMLSSEQKGFMIFDEILSAMDEDRARLIMETITQVSDCQIIFISHSQDINTIADRTFLLEKNQTITKEEFNLFN